MDARPREHFGTLVDEIFNSVVESHLDAGEDQVEGDGDLCHNGSFEELSDSGSSLSSGELQSPDWDELVLMHGLVNTSASAAELARGPRAAADAAKAAAAAAAAAASAARKRRKEGKDGEKKKKSFARKVSKFVKGLL